MIIKKLTITITKMILITRISLLLLSTKLRTNQEKTDRGRQKSKSNTQTNIANSPISCNNCSCAYALRTMLHTAVPTISPLNIWTVITQ